MKKVLSVIVLALISLGMFAQVTNMNIHKTDGSVTSINIADIDSVTYSTTTPPPVEGEGTFESPYTVESAIANNTGNNVWVQGFMAGVVKSGDVNQAQLNAPFESQTNVYIAPTASETDTTKMLIVQLPGGDIRTQANLQDNPNLHGKEIKFRGNLKPYFQVPGLKGTTGYWLVEENTGINPDYVAPGTIYSENFSDIVEPYDPLTTMTVIILEGTKDWHGDGYNGKSAEMSAYQSGEDLNQAWLITPAIDLTSATNPKLTFNTSLKYHEGDLLTVYICTDFDEANPSAATWVELEDAHIAQNDDPEVGGGFKGAGSGDIDLSSYVGSSNVRIGWFYNGSGNSGQTTKYRVDDILVVEE